MQAITIQEKLHQYVDKADIKLLKLMYALAREYNEEDDYDYEFSLEDIQKFDERREKRLRGESKIYSSKEAKNIITGKKVME